MKDALTKVLTVADRDDASVDRIMAASFFRPRGCAAQAGTTAQIIRLDERRTSGARHSS